MAQEGFYADAGGMVFHITPTKPESNDAYTSEIEHLAELNVELEKRWTSLRTELTNTSPDDPYALWVDDQMALTMHEIRQNLRETKILEEGLKACVQRNKRRTAEFAFFKDLITSQTAKKLRYE